MADSIISFGIDGAAADLNSLGHGHKTVGLAKMYACYSAHSITSTAGDGDLAIKSYVFLCYRSFKVDFPTAFDLTVFTDNYFCIISQIIDISGTRYSNLCCRIALAAGTAGRLKISIVGRIGKLSRHPHDTERPCKNILDLVTDRTVRSIGADGLRRRCQCFCSRVAFRTVGIIRISRQFLLVLRSFLFQLRCMRFIGSIGSIGRF